MKIFKLFIAAFAAALLLAGCGEEKSQISQKTVLERQFTEKYKNVLSISQTQSLLGYGSVSDVPGAMAVLKKQGLAEEAAKELKAIKEAK